MNQQYDKIWTNALLATCEQGYGLLENAAIAVKDGKIAWIGSMADLPQVPEKLAQEVHDVSGYCITPGFIDCHTHIVYAGNRAKEFELRLQGVSYEEIASQGGGIQATVNATRNASVEELLQQSIKRVIALQASGVTTLEIKSGYGLDLATELKILGVAKLIAETLPVTVKSTFLGAHTIPREYQGKSDQYVDLICEQMIPEVAEKKLADAVDVFCEKIAFNLEQTEKIFRVAKKNGLTIKCHAEQLSYSGSAALAANYDALSVDHLEHLATKDIDLLATMGTVAVLLPGAFYFLRETKLPPIAQLREANIPIAIATDSNPGTSPVLSMLVILHMACTIFRMTPEEALAGVTKHAAKALGLEKTHGTLTLGKAADFAIWDINHPLELMYYLGDNPLVQLIKNGMAVSVF